MPTMTVTINTADKRDVRALRILQGARGWAKATLQIPGVGPRKAYGVPSESDSNRFHYVNKRQCSCPDFQNRQDGGSFACAHIRAVRWYCEIVAQEARKRELVAAQDEARRVRESNEEARRTESLGLVDAF